MDTKILPKVAAHLSCGAVDAHNPAVLVVQIFFGQESLLNFLGDLDFFLNDLQDLLFFKELHIFNDLCRLCPDDSQELSVGIVEPALVALVEGHQNAEQSVERQERSSYQRPNADPCERYAAEAGICCRIIADEHGLVLEHPSE